MKSVKTWLLVGFVTGWALGAGAAPPPGHRQLFSGTWFHAPVADDDCTVCHTVHRNPVGPNLQAPVPELCYSCHENMAARDEVHEPVGEGRCTDCHLVHTSDEKKLLVRRVPELCYECHPPDREHVARNTLCPSCHEVHSSDTARFLKGERTRNCGRCHADKRKGESLHEPAREGKCLTCHFTHPDPRFENRGLRGSYPRTPYAPYGEGTYGLCDRCHPRALHVDPGFRETRFRTRDENLHARHVRGDPGVACSACHDVHASDRAALVSAWVRLPGKEPTPMGFIAFSTGGTCGPSCHGTTTYVREAPEEELR
ncbi:MAG: cytochrome c3 family protein [Deferrisoma sp.]